MENDLGLFMLTPSYEGFAVRLPSDAVRDSTKYYGHPQKTHLRNGMSVYKAWKQGGKQNAHGHDDGKHDCPKVLHRVEDKKLSHSGANAENDKM